MKKKICTLLILAITFSLLFVSAQSTVPFSDVSPNHWAYDAISYFYSAEVINGMSDTTYAPDENITREQLAKLLSVLFGKTHASGTQTFSDVSKNRWSYPYIESVKDYLTGYFPVGGTPFYNPAAKATREDIAYALVRISGSAEGNVAVLEEFSDASSVSPKLAPFVAAAVENGLMQGYDGTLRPQDGVTRAEAAVLLFRAIKQPVYTAPTETVPPEATPVPETTPSPQETPMPEVTPAPSPVPEQETEKAPEPESDDAVLTLTKFQQISGYRDNEIKGELRVSFDSAAPQFSAVLKCYEGLGYTLCEIRLDRCTAVSVDTLEGYFTVKLDGKPRHTHIKGTATLSDGILTLHTEDYDYNLAALMDNAAAPAPKEKENLYSSMVLSAKSTDKNAVSGLLQLIYDEEKATADVQGKITVNGTAYTVSSASITAISPGSITGMFSIGADSSSPAKSIEGTLSGLDTGLGGLVRFKTADDTFDIQLLITEIMN